MLLASGSRIRKTDSRSGKDRRSGLDRRAGLERRKHQRRIMVVPVATERRSGRDRRQHVRRSGTVRRTITDRRGRRIKRLSGRERAQARGLAEECLAATGTPVDRITQVVANAWADYPVAIRTGIAKDLFPLLRPVIEGRTEVTEELRRECEKVLERRAGRIRAS